jgi:hypothetical protein
VRSGACMRVAPSREVYFEIYYEEGESKVKGCRRHISWRMLQRVQGAVDAGRHDARTRWLGARRLRGRSEVRTGACMRVAPSRELYFEVYL